MVGSNKTMISEEWHKEGDHLEKLVKYLNLFYFEIRPFFLFLPRFSSYPSIHSSGAYSDMLYVQIAKINGISVPRKYTH